MVDPIFYYITLHHFCVLTKSKVRSAAAAHFRLPCQMVALRPFTVSLDSIFAFRKASGHDATGHDARGKKGHRGYMPYSKHID